MNVTSERSRSLWMETASSIDAAPLRRDAEADVIVVGSGIAGLTTAYELAGAGKAVILVDRGPIAGGMSSRTSAHLASSLDDLYSELIRLRGLDDAKLCYQSQDRAIGFIEQTAGKEGIACDFRRLDGYLFVAPGTDEKMLEHEIEACHQVGYADVGWVDRVPFAGVETGRALRFPRQGRFHPRKYLRGLAEAAMRRGMQAFADTEIQQIDEHGGRVVLKTASGHSLKGSAAVVATNSPINDRVAIHTKQAPYRTYVIAGRVPKGRVVDALYWDTADPYHYVRLQPGDGFDMLIVGGEDHKTGEADDAAARFGRLDEWARLHVPELGDIEHRWSGQVMEPVDFLPFIGRNPGNDRIFVATGDSGQGLTNGTAAAILLSDLILDRANPWTELFAPSRKTLKAAGRFAQENVTMVTNLAEHVSGGSIRSVDDLGRGEGGLVRSGLAKLAVFRDEDGNLHACSATCTHMGCVVHWNSFERCWDCPCHGSHFSVDGEVLNGPATSPLAKAEIDRTKGDDGRRSSERSTSAGGAD